MQNNKKWKKIEIFFTAAMKTGNQIQRLKKFLMKKQNMLYMLLIYF